MISYTLEQKHDASFMQPEIMHATSKGGLADTDTWPMSWAISIQGTTTEISSKSIEPRDRSWCTICCTHVVPHFGLVTTRTSPGRGLCKRVRFCYMQGKARALCAHKHKSLYGNKLSEWGANLKSRPFIRPSSVSNPLKRFLNSFIARVAASPCSIGIV